MDQVTGSPEFRAWPKTPRLYRDITITEKIDGTNTAVIIQRFSLREFNEIAFDFDKRGWTAAFLQSHEDGDYAVLIGAQSRRRIITPGKDSDCFGFAAWVSENAEALLDVLGEGTHFGEWFGRGIQRGYGMQERQWALFNTEKYEGVDFANLGLPQVRTVPALYEGPFNEDAIQGVLSVLRDRGSRISLPTHRDGVRQQAEGICIYFHASRSVMKVLLENDELPKGVADVA